VIGARIHGFLREVEPRRMDVESGGFKARRDVRGEGRSVSTTANVAGKRASSNNTERLVA